MQFVAGGKLPSVSALDEVGTLVTERSGALVPAVMAADGQARHKRPRPLPPEHARRRPPWAATDTLIVVGLVALGVALPAAAALWSHAFGIPRYDDWAYRRVLSEFVNTGHISLVGWGAMTLVGQVCWAAAFCHRLWWASMGGRRLGGGRFGHRDRRSAYWLARAVVGRAWGAACTLLVLAVPGFLVNTSTFMTDLPALSAEVACLALGVAALGRTGGARWALIAGSMAVGCAGFSVREFDLAAPMAVLVVLALQDGTGAVWARKSPGRRTRRRTRGRPGRRLALFCRRRRPARSLRRHLRMDVAPLRCPA